MKKMLLALICLLCFETGISQSIQETIIDKMPWLILHTGDNFAVKVERSSIERIADKIYCWEKTEYTDEEKKKQALKWQEIMKDEKFLNFDYMLKFVVYDCIGKGSQILVLALYDDKGVCLFNHERLESTLNYQRIIPGTVGMSMFDTLAKKRIFVVDGQKIGVFMEDTLRFIIEHPSVEYFGDDWQTTMEYILMKTVRQHFEDNNGTIDETTFYPQLAEALVKKLAEQIGAN